MYLMNAQTGKIPIYLKIKLKKKIFKTKVWVVQYQVVISEIIYKKVTL